MKTNLLHLCKRISVNIHKTFTYIEESFFCRPIAMTSLVNTWKPKWRSERPDANPLASLRQKDFYPACPLSAYFFSFLKISQKSDRILVLLFNDFFGYRASLTAQLLRASLLRMITQVLWMAIWGLWMVNQSLWMATNGLCIATLAFGQPLGASGKSLRASGKPLWATKEPLRVFREPLGTSNTLSIITRRESLWKKESGFLSKTMQQRISYKSFLLIGYCTTPPLPPWFSLSLD